MSARQPLAALVKISELGRSPGRQKSLDAGTAELRNLLSRPLAPLSNLDERERRRITDARLVSLKAAFAQIRPAWIADYAAAAAIALPPREKRLREFMLRELFRSQENAGQAFAAIAKALQEQPGKRRDGILPVVLRSVSLLTEAPRTSSEEAEALLMGLVEATNPPTSPKAFAQLAIDVALAAQALSAGALQTTVDDARSPVDAVLAQLDPPYAAFLHRPRWGSFAPEISAALWEQLWRRWRKPALVDAPAPTQQFLLKEAAWSEADQALARALQDSGRLARSLEKLESAAGGDTARQLASVRGASNLVLQWVRQAARLRNMECKTAMGDVTAFDPELHESHEAEPGERVRILKPTVMRSNGSQQAVVLRGEVELE